MKSTLKYLLITLALTLMSVIAVYAQSNAQSDACRDVDGQANFVVRIGVPDDAVPVGGVFCRVLHNGTSWERTPATIGNVEVLRRGVSAAVEIFGLSGSTAINNFDREMQICLRGTGTLVFINTAVQPRLISDMPAVLRDLETGTYTCTFISTSGYLSLVAGPTAPRASEILATQSETEPGLEGLTTAVIESVPGIETLSGCRVTTTATVRLREEPNTSSPVLTRLPFETSYQATARTAGWVRVIYLDGQGWVSDRFVNESAGCFE